MNEASSASGPVEVEFKLLLADEAARERLLAVLLRPGARPIAPVRQENHFLDTADGVLRAARHVVRLRREEGDWTLALKGPALSEGRGPTRRAEEERKVSPETAHAILAGATSPLDAFRREPQAVLLAPIERLVEGRALTVIGSFANERTRLAADAVVRELGLGVELDRTTFPGARTELELEVELPADVDPAPVELALRLLLERARVPWTPATGKAGRFFRILDRMREAPPKPASRVDLG